MYKRFSWIQMRYIPPYALMIPLYAYEQYLGHIKTLLLLITIYNNKLLIHQLFKSACLKNCYNHIDNI